MQSAYLFFYKHINIFHSFENYIQIFEPSCICYIHIHTYVTYICKYIFPFLVLKIADKNLTKDSLRQVGAIKLLPYFVTLL